MSLCERVLDNDYEVLRARRLTIDEAKALPGASIPSVDGKQPAYMASCKVRLVDTRLPKIPPEGAILVADDGAGGSSSYVTDRFWQ